jgi:hypothetical protein
MLDCLPRSVLALARACCPSGWRGHCTIVWYTMAPGLGCGFELLLAVAPQVFESHGSFEPLKEEYMQAWLHTGQQLQLEGQPGQVGHHRTTLGVKMGCVAVSSSTGTCQCIACFLAWTMP